MRSNFNLSKDIIEAVVHRLQNGKIDAIISNDYTTILTIAAERLNGDVHATSQYNFISAKVEFTNRLRKAAPK